MGNKVYIDYERFKRDVFDLASRIPADKFKNIYAIPRGGINVALALTRYLELPLVDKIGEDTLIVDDLVDSGRTISDIFQRVDLHDGFGFTHNVAVLYIKPHSPKPTYFVATLDGWIEFFYEATKKDIEDNVTRMLEYIGENPTREGLVATPSRVVRMWEEIFGGYKKDPAELFKSVFTSDLDEMVVVKDIPFFSHCEHHLVPFFGYVHVAYIPQGKVLGLSKFSRLVEIYARRLQIQEKFTQEIADMIEKHLNPLGVAVIVEARHLCTEMRGVKKHNNTTITSVTRGAFRTNIHTRNELLELIKK